MMTRQSLYIVKLIAALLLFTALGTAQTPLANEPKLPDTPVAKVLGKFLQAFNSGKLETMQQFHREMGGDEENAQKDKGFYEQSGGLRLHRIVQSSDFEITVLMQSRKDAAWVNFNVAVESQAPHAIMGIRVQPGEAPANESKPPRESNTAPAGKRNEADALKDIGALIEQQAAADNFSGVVMIAKNGAPLFTRAVGLADKTKNLPNRADTKFNLGSINKVFTQIAIWQLIEAGKLTLEDKLGRHLPAYPNAQAREKVTIAHLLNMQSGIGDFFGPKFDATPKSKIRTINDYLPLFADEALKFEPGTSRAYSNGGYIVLGAIIEKVTGQSYYDYVRQRIFQLAGMLNTESYESDAKVANLAQGYTKRESASGERVSNVNTRPARGSSAGGGYSTADDLLKFVQAINANKLLNAEHSRRFGGIGVAGGAPGINAILDINMRGGYTVIVLSNYDPPSAEDLGEKIRQTLAGIA
jgi:CubicO group peptidase (beta-lactamase class C family)